MGTCSWWWSRQTPKVYFQNLKIVIFHGSKKPQSIWRCKNNCLYILESNDLTLFSFTKADTPSWITLKLFFISWKCFHGLVVWIRWFLWTWLCCLTCFSVFTSLTAMGLIQHGNCHKWQALGVFSGHTRIIPHLWGVAHFFTYNL